jgi:hypothetical protein
MDRRHPRLIGRVGHDDQRLEPTQEVGRPWYALEQQPFSKRTVAQLADYIQ